MKINLIRKMQLFKNNLSFLLGMLKSFFFDIRYSEPKIRFFFDYCLSADARNWFRQASSTDDESGCALSFCWWSHLLLGFAILSSCVCSSSGAFLLQPLFGAYKLWCAEQSPAPVSWINDCCDDVQTLISYGETNQTSKGIPPPTYYVVVQLISRADACRYHRRVNWKRQTASWNLTLIDETGSVFSKNTSKPPMARSQFRHAICIPALVGVRGRRHGVNKGNDRGETGRVQLASALSRRPYIRHTCSLHDETRLEYRPHFVLTICQCQPSACFTRGVRLLLIIIKLHRRRHATRYILFPIHQWSERILTDIRYQSICIS